VGSGIGSKTGERGQVLLGRGGGETGGGSRKGGSTSTRTPGLRGERDLEFFVGVDSVWNLRSEVAVLEWSVRLSALPRGVTC